MSQNLLVNDYFFRACALNVVQITNTVQKLDILPLNTKI